MAKKTININGSATQMVDDINDNFDELYEGAGAGSVVKDHAEAYTTETATYTSGKVMTNSNGKLVFADDASTSRKIFCIDIDADDDSVAYTVNQVASDSNQIGYALVDAEDNIIASEVGTTTATDYKCLVSLADVRKIYISKAPSATSASIGVVVFGEGRYTEDDGEVQVSGNEGQYLTSFYKKIPSSATLDSVFTPATCFASNANAETVVALISGCKTLEGYGYSPSSNYYNYVILDKELKIIGRDNFPPMDTNFATTTSYMHLPAGAKFLLFTDRNNGNVTRFFLKTRLPECEYYILALGNSFTRNYWQYVPAILNEWYGDKIHFTIFAGLYDASTFESWKDYLVSGTSARAMSVTVHGSWRGYGNTTTPRSSANAIFAAYSFDLVGFQQVSTQSANYATISPYWISAVKALSRLANKHTDVMWTMTHATTYGRASDSQVGDVDYTDTMMGNIFTVNEQFAEDFAVDICPVGTAIQNARHTGINDLEWAGDNPGAMMPDARHLQAGFACFIAGLVVARFVGKKLGIDIQCYGDKMNIDAEFDAAYSKLTTYGSPVYATDADMNYLAQRCVEAAMRFPFEIKTNLGTT